VGATTRTGLITGPLQTRFGIVLRLDFYTPAQLAMIVERSARLLGTKIQPEAALEIAKRSRGTPRIANRLLRRAWDFSLVARAPEIELATARTALNRMGVDHAGLDEMDRRILDILIRFYDGGPTGIETLAAAAAEPRDTLEDVYEPYLLREGFLARTPRGRVATRRAYEHLGARIPRDAADDPPPQGTLFE
jgi:Holliday junction DNA helicase RuvB